MDLYTVGGKDQNNRMMMNNELIYYNAPLIYVLHGLCSR